MTPSSPGTVDLPEGEACPRTEGREQFRPASRILRRADYLETYARGRKSVGRYFVVFQRGNASSKNRLGITVTRKSGGSVTRNRIRRQVRELFRRSSWVAPAGPGRGSDFVVNVREGAVDASFEEMKNDLIRLLERVAPRRTP